MDNNENSIYTLIQTQLTHINQSVQNLHAELNLTKTMIADRLRTVDVLEEKCSNLAKDINNVGSLRTDDSKAIWRAVGELRRLVWKLTLGIGGIAGAAGYSVDKIF